jgi:hypothetical protein
VDGVPQLPANAANEGGQRAAWAPSAHVA